MMEDSHQELSVLSAFLKRKIKEKGLSVDDVVKKSGLSRRYIYELISVKRDSIPTDEALNKLATALDFTEEDKNYIFDIARRERESGEIIYSDVGSTPFPVPSPEIPSPHPSESPPNSSQSGAQVPSSGHEEIQPSEGTPTQPQESVIQPPTQPENLPDQIEQSGGSQIISCQPSGRELTLAEQVLFGSAKIMLRIFGWR